ncbi:MAG TPA: TonB C-terminal domain-containing protein [Polyangia bacterium]|nr:TonB C-terminal domain-containing protein [Polyangia bacterium]
MGRFRPSVLALLALACLSAKAGAAEPAPATGDDEPPITTPGAEGDYLREMHRLIHYRWANQFIKGVADKRPAGDPLNRAKDAELLFVVRWDGSLGEITVSETSGVPEFDAAAVAAIKVQGRFPVPPVDIYGDDGVAHFRWVFARGPRLCSGGEVRHVEAPLAEALPRLFYQGRIKEALLRATRYTRKGDAGAMSTFARAWLSRRFSDPVLDARAAAALAMTGDARQAERLKPALERPETVDLAAPALASIRVDLCALVQPRLESAKPEGVAQATRILRAAHAQLPAESPCVGALANLVKNEFLPAPSRAEALQTLALVNAQAAHRPALNALGDKDAQVRAAGANAFAHPGGGRPTLYRLEPLLKDPSVGVRTAAAGGLVRACGDLANDYLAPVLKAHESEPVGAMVPELAKLSTPASLDLLQKIAKRNDPELRLPLLAALAQRKDAPAHAVYQTMAAAVKKDPYATPAARQIVYANADIAELQPLMKDPVVGLFGFKALLHAQRQADAMDWLVTSFDRLPPETLVDALGAWLANPPGHAASK